MIDENLILITVSYEFAVFPKNGGRAIISIGAFIRCNQIIGETDVIILHVGEHDFLNGRSYTQCARIATAVKCLEHPCNGSPAANSVKFAVVYNNHHVVKTAIISSSGGAVRHQTGIKRFAGDRNVRRGLTGRRCCIGIALGIQIGCKKEQR